MSVLLGGDSAGPQPNHYQGKKVWGVYVAGATPHIWTHAEVAELAKHGIEGFLPIVVPPQDVRWWDDNFGYPTMEALVREAVAWGLPKGAPICLDVEEFQSSQMSSPGDVLHAWAVACATHSMRDWTYGSEAFLRNDMWGLRWMAAWPDVTPVNPQLPQGFQGWQYKGNTNGIDLDIFEEGRDYVSPGLKLVNLPLKPVVPIKPPHPKGKTMSSTTITYPTLATLKSWVRQLSSIAGIVVSIGNQLHLPVSTRAILLAGSVWIQREQHLIDTTNDPTTPTTPVATTNPPTPAP